MDLVNCARFNFNAAHLEGASIDRFSFYEAQLVDTEWGDLHTSSLNFEPDNDAIPMPHNIGSDYALVGEIEFKEIFADDLGTWNRWRDRNIFIPVNLEGG